MGAATILNIVGDFYGSLSDDGDERRLLDLLCGGIGGQHVLMTRLSPCASPEWLTCTNLALPACELEALSREGSYYTALRTLSLARPLRLTDVSPRSEILNSAWYNEVLRGHGGGLALLAMCQDGHDTVVTTICRSAAHDRDFEDDAVAMLIALLPHLSAASGLARQLTRERSRARTAFDALDCLSDGAIVLDGSGKLIHANRSAEAMLSTGDILRRTARGVGALWPPDDAKLQGAIRSAFAMNIRQGDPADVMQELTQPMQIAIGGLPALILTVVPARSIIATDRAERAIIIHIADPGKARCLPIQTLRQQFGLTVREAELARQLTSSDTLAQAAADLNISVGTARQYLKAIFGKIGVHRQSDLVRRISI